ncbi:Uncharacterised protein [uncultured Butyricicoccus sp.]|nr:Uncharacterised protein [uncultured Butyricicoccus sp.]
MVFIPGVFLIPIGCEIPDEFPFLHFRAQGAADFPAGIARIHLIDNIAERRHIGIRPRGIEPVIDRDQTHAVFWEHQLYISSDLDIIAPQAGQVLDQHDVEPVLLHIAQHVLKARAVEVRPRPPVVYILVRHREALPCGILPQQGTLVMDALALTPVGVIAAQPQI